MTKENVIIPRLSDEILDFAVSMFGLNLWGDYINKKLKKDECGLFEVHMSEQQIQAVCELIENYNNAITVEVEVD